MKFKSFCRVVAGMLTAVFLLSLLPVMAVAQTQTPPAKEYTEDFDGEAITDVVTRSPNLCTVENNALNFKVEPKGNHNYYLWVNSNNFWEITDVYRDGLNLTGTANGTSISTETVNTELPLYDEVFVRGDDTYYVVSGDFADAYGGAGNIASPARLKNPEFAYEDEKWVAVELDLTLSSDFSCAAGFSSRVSSNLGLVELFEIKATSSTSTVSFDHHENGVDLMGGAVTLTRGSLHHIQILIDLSTATRKVFVDGEFAAYQSNVTGRAPIRQQISLSENTLDFQIDRGGAPSTYGGSVTIDNVEMYSFSASPYYDVEAHAEDDGKAVSDADEFVSVPSLATFATMEDGNTALRLDMSSSHSADSYALITRDGRTVKAWDLEWDPTSPFEGSVAGTPLSFRWEPSTGTYITTYGGTTAYVVKDTVAGTAFGDDNVAKAFKLKHERFFPTGTACGVLLEADYFIEEGSTGIIEAQFEAFKYNNGASTGSWIQMFTVDMQTGCFDATNVSLSIGEWNNVKVFMDLKTGTYDMYVNGVFAKREEVGQANIEIGYNENSMWSFAKIQRTTNMMAKENVGALYVDNVRVCLEEKVSDATFAEDAFLDDASFEGFAESIFEMVNGASIRLTDPTGLRFACRVNTDHLAHLTSLLEEGTVSEMGILITPSDYVEEAGEFTVEALDRLNHTSNYIKLAFDGAYYPYWAGTGLPEASYLSGSITELRAANVDRDFSARAYLKLSLEGGDLYVYSGSVERNIKDVAKAALNDPNMKWSENNQAVLEAYADGKPPQK